MESINNNISKKAFDNCMKKAIIRIADARGFKLVSEDENKINFKYDSNDKIDMVIKLEDMVNVSLSNGDRVSSESFIFNNDDFEEALIRMTADFLKDHDLDFDVRESFKDIMRDLLEIY